MPFLNKRYRVLAATIYLLILCLFAYLFRNGSPNGFPIWTAVFFVIILLSIAIFPLLNSEWWGKNYGYVTLLIAIPAAIIILETEKVLLLHTFMEYASFIILIGSLFTIAGGIVIRTSLKGTPIVNCLLLLTGSVFANLIGTTGASMVLLRPLIRLNRGRKSVRHIFIFFIFLVSNVGGLLTPLGDPPLFLGFLRGVPFFWTLKLIPIWFVAVFILLGIFYLIDKRSLKKEEKMDHLEDLKEMPQKRFEIRGKINFIFLLMVIGSFFIPPLAREIVMLLAAGLSVYLTPVAMREENAFTYHPIIEVAILFAGIFTTMVPALQILQENGAKMGVTEPWHFFWATGSLSSFLDNAPTYLVFVAVANSVAITNGITNNLIIGVPEIYLRAISTRAVFMGANSYIGNGPNFMVKAICEENNIPMPSFFGYMGWSIGILIPVFVLLTFIFFV
jgi:Na+/H+ antiporter NhaD/arsenite permease-like protein